MAALVAQKQSNQVDTVLSDLYFNHEHPSYEKLWVSLTDNRRGNVDRVTQQQLYASCVADATEFLISYGSLFICDLPSPAQLANDFINRI